MILNLTTRTGYSCRSAPKLPQVRDVLIAVSFARGYILIQLKATSRRHRLIRLADGIFGTVTIALVLTARNDAAGDEQRCAGPPHRGQGL